MKIISRWQTFIVIVRDHSNSTFFNKFISSLIRVSIIMSKRDNPWSDNEINCLVSYMSDERVRTYNHAPTGSPLIVKLYAFLSEKLNNNGYVRSQQAIHLKVEELKYNYYKVLNCIVKLKQDINQTNVKEHGFRWFEQLHKIYSRAKIVKHNPPPMNGGGRSNDGALLRVRNFPQQMPNVNNFRDIELMKAEAGRLKSLLDYQYQVAMNAKLTYENYTILSQETNSALQSIINAINFLTHPGTNKNQPPQSISSNTNWQQNCSYQPMQGMNQEVIINQQNVFQQGNSYNQMPQNAVYSIAQAPMNVSIQPNYHQQMQTQQYVQFDPSQAPPNYKGPPRFSYRNMNQPQIQQGNSQAPMQHGTNFAPPSYIPLLAPITSMAHQHNRERIKVIIPPSKPAKFEEPMHVVPETAEQAQIKKLNSQSSEPEKPSSPLRQINVDENKLSISSSTSPTTPTQSAAMNSSTPEIITEESE